MQKSNGNPNSIESTGAALLEKIWRNKQRPRAMWGVAPFGIPTLDLLTGGIQDHWLMFLGARPQVGKSVLAGQIALNVAKHFNDWTNREREVFIDRDAYGNEFENERLILEDGQPIYKPKNQWKYVKIISFEMTREMYLQRIACGEARVSSYKIESGIGLTDEEAERVHSAVEDLIALPLAMWDTPGSIKMVENFLTRKDETTGLWILDHIGLFKEVKDNTNFKTGAIGNASNACLDMAHTIAPGLVIAHMNRASESNADKKPTLANFAGADDISKDADLALGLHRPWMFADISEEEKSGIQPAELLMLKHRHNPGWNIQMVYNPKLTKFKEDEPQNEGAKRLIA